MRKFVEINFEVFLWNSYTMPKGLSWHESDICTQLELVMTEKTACKSNSAETSMNLYLETFQKEGLEIDDLKSLFFSCFEVYYKYL